MVFLGFLWFSFFVGLCFVGPVGLVGPWVGFGPWVWWVRGSDGPMGLVDFVGCWLKSNF